MGDKRLPDQKLNFSQATRNRNPAIVLPSVLVSYRVPGLLSITSNSLSATMTTTEADAAAGTTRPAAAKTTKRQRTKALQNDPQKNVWMTQNTSKIQDPAKREMAYLRAAGFGRKKQEEEPSYANFCRALGSADHQIRHRAVRALQVYVQQRAEKRGITEKEIQHLSYAVWHALYMADRVPVQEAVAKAVVQIVLHSLTGETIEEDEYAAAQYIRMKEEEEAEELLEEEEEEDADISEPEEEEIDWERKQLELIENGDDEEEAADDDDLRLPGDGDVSDDTEMEEENDEDVDPLTIPHCRGAHLASCFFRNFLSTVVQKWPDMDKYRLDKFYTCLRFLLAELFGYLSDRGWNPGLIRMFNDDLWNVVYSTVPNGVRYHIMDIFLEELVQVGADSVTEAIFLELLQPLLFLAQTGAPERDDTVHTRVVERVMERFLDQYSVYRQEGDDNDDAASSLVFRQVHVGTVAAVIFDIASDENTTHPMYRKNLYDVYKKYTKRIRAVGSDKDVKLDDLGEKDEVAELGEEFPEEMRAAAIGKSMNDNRCVEKGDSEASPVDQTGQLDGADTTKSKKKKRKKKRKKDAELASDEASGGNDAAVERTPAPQRDEIVISVQEQRAFKAAVAKQQKLVDSSTKTVGKEMKRKGDVDIPDSSDSKRVKFDQKNRAKSYKASMKGLRNADMITPKTSPEKGILLNKDAVIPPKSAPAKFGKKGKKKGKKSRQSLF